MSEGNDPRPLELGPASKAGWEMAEVKFCLEWLAGLGRARAKAYRSAASGEIDMPVEWRSIRQAHKHHLASLFDRIAAQLESGKPLADMAAALDLIAYEQGYSTILGLTRAEDLALRALGEGARFSVGLGSNLWRTDVAAS